MGWGRKWRKPRSFGARRFGPRMKPRPPVRPAIIPAAHEFPTYVVPEVPGAGRFEHWTERRVQPDIVRFTKEVLRFRKPELKTHFAETGNVDTIVVDVGRRARPCARFEVKSAQPYVEDIHARAGRRVGRYRLSPRQHKLHKRGVCDLFYVLVPAVGKRRVEHVGICNIPMIEEILEKPITTDIGVHRKAAFECPDVNTWVTFAREERARKRRARRKR